MGWGWDGGPYSPEERPWPWPGREGGSWDPTRDCLRPGRVRHCVCEVPMSLVLHAERDLRGPEALCQTPQEARPKALSGGKNLRPALEVELRGRLDELDWLRWVGFSSLESWSPERTGP